MSVRHIFLLTVIIFAVISLTVVQVVVSNKLSTAGKELSQITDKIEEQKLANEILKAQIASMSAFTNIAKNAQKLGYARDNSPLVLGGKELFALR